MVSDSLAVSLIFFVVSPEAVVAESVVVIKKLLQLQPKENKDLIIQVAKMAGRVEVCLLRYCCVVIMVCVVQVPGAKASILWLVGEYCTLVPKIAPDILRKAAKDFINEVLTTCVT